MVRAAGSRSAGRVRQQNLRRRESFSSRGASGLHGNPFRSITVTTTVVRYRTRLEAATENAALIAQVFAELDAMRPTGLRYIVMRVEESEFVHIAISDVEPSPLQGLPAFRRFREAVQQRCVEPPRSARGEVLGQFGWIGP
jgi:hypothetical protein